jgi:Putative zinc-finger
VNRCVAEGRERFRRIVAASEDGSRCDELWPMLSAFCDGEVGAAEAAAVREHLRACAGCRATVRAYRAAPADVAALLPGALAGALAPSLPASRSLLQRAHELLWNVQSRLPGGGGAADSPLAQAAAAGGAKGAGIATLAKALAICAGTVGGAAACVAAGVVPAPLDLAPTHERAAKVERVSHRTLEEASAPKVEYQPAPEPVAAPKPEKKHVESGTPAPASEAAPPAEASAGAAEYTPPPTPPPVEEAPVSEPSGSPAGEFGP